ncbi:archaeosortase A [Haloarchaeobius baliensis]|uniref:archaeosortase A n=1 Tax=Haloarchaeobius baliensis TaxID=1670458 RepID=UPI003F881FB1
MPLLRTVTLVDGVFVACVVALWVACLGYLTDHEEPARAVALAGWSTFALFWAYTSLDYLTTSRTFLGSIGLVTVVLSAYTVSLVARRADAGTRLTVAFAVMGLLFLPFEFVEPIHRAVLGGVAAHTAWGLSLVGFDPVIGYGPQGYPNAVYFVGLPPRYGIAIVSACSGISAISLFAGLVVATRAPPKRRLAFAVGIGAFVYLLNVVRAMFVAGALGGPWFGFAAGVTGSLYGVTDPRLASYYVAEYLVSQVLIVVVLLWVYVRLSSMLPELQELVGGVVDTATADWRRLTGQM